MIRRELQFDPFGLFLATISLSFIIALYQPKIERYFGLYCQLWYIKFCLKWKWIEDILLTSICIVSIAFIDADANLFELTTMQVVVILIICKGYAFDLGQCFILSSDFRWPILIFCHCLEIIDIAHHIIGLIGCGYLLWACCGGSVIVRLLLDILTNFALNIRENYPQWFYGLMIRQRLCNKFFWIICIVIRLFYYPFILVQSLITISKSISMSDHTVHHNVLFMLLTCWLVFSTIYHIIWIRDAYNNSCDCHDRDLD